jgi:hypothetical protein
VTGRTTCGKACESGRPAETVEQTADLRPANRKRLRNLRQKRQ